MQRAVERGWRAAVVVLALALVATSCGIDVDAVRADQRSASTTTGPSGGTGSPSRPPSATAADVDDPLFAGLGDPRIDVSRYDVTLVSSPGTDAVRGTVTIDARVVTRTALTAFTLDLHALTVSNVTVAGRQAPSEADGDQVVVTPASPLPAGRPFVAVVDYGGVPEAVALAALPGVAIGWQRDQQGGTFTVSEPYGTRTWMPVSDHPSDKAAYRFRLDVPDGVEAVANGRLVSRRPSTTAGRTVWTWDQPEPMASYLALVAVGQYDLVRRRGPAGVPVIEAFPAGTRARGVAAFARLDAMVELLARTFGPYPFAAVGAIVVPAALTFALETQTRPVFGTYALESGGRTDGVILHELAHQWFGDDVSLLRWRDVWLNEGFATYAEWLWAEAEGGEPVSEAASRAHRMLGSATSAVAHPSPDEVFGPAVYQRGAVTLYALRRTVGDATFARILRRWVASRGGRGGTTAAFEKLATRVAGRDLTSFFRAWLDEADVPALP